MIPDWTNAGGETRTHTLPKINSKNSWKRDKTPEKKQSPANHH